MFLRKRKIRVYYITRKGEKVKEFTIDEGRHKRHIYTLYKDNFNSIRVEIDR
jgi:hypothetical protein